MKNPSEPATVTVHVPMRFAIHGGRKLIISDTDEKSGGRLFNRPSNDAPRQRTENALLKALARAHRWRQMIESGAYASITDLAKAENVNQSYACRVLRLTLLAPSIIDEILDGRCPPDLMLKRVMRRLPIWWEEQKVVLAQPELGR